MTITIVKVSPKRWSAICRFCETGFTYELSDIAQDANSYEEPRLGRSRRRAYVLCPACKFPADHSPLGDFSAGTDESTK